jgi:hypothetical protein
MLDFWMMYQTTGISVTTHDELVVPLLEMLDIRIRGLS